MGRIPHLIRIGGTPKLGVTEEDFESAAMELAVDVELIKAVAEVETKKSPFDSSGRPTILFERHYFHRLTNGAFDASNPRISNPVGSYMDGSYGKWSVQYDKLWQAYKLDPSAALMSASWGRFQIMGENFSSTGYSSVEAFVVALSESESAHLKAFVAHVKSRPAMLAALRAHDWRGFALRYNGSDYERTGYHTAMQSAYNSLVKQRSKQGP